MDEKDLPQKAQKEHKKDAPFFLCAECGFVVNFPFLNLLTQMKPDVKSASITAVLSISCSLPVGTELQGCFPEIESAFALRRGLLS